ncbi:MAG: HIT family protein [Bacteroidetes bacterium]|nr:HIT family protein [Bacteroidota bacterium]
MSSIFTKIINGEIPCFKVAESKDYFAFLDIRPLTKGHTLVVPKVEVDYIFDLDIENFAGLHLFSKIVAEAIQKSVNCKRVGITVIGLEVPHAHIHLIPFNTMNEMNFSNPKLEISTQEMQAIADKIKSNLPA